MENKLVVRNVESLACWTERIAAQYARENNYKMNAICSYVVSAFDKSDAYDDVKS